jgi:hypothetical protein
MLLAAQELERIDAVGLAELQSAIVLPTSGDVAETRSSVTYLPIVSAGMSAGMSFGNSQRPISIR